ncbi:MAG TPA: cytochrome P450 [Pseudonocardia sp.]|nr:cytochrome P450 [Pseudonocardia sp.]
MIEYNPYDPEVKRDPHPRFARLRRECPVHHHVLDAARAGRISENPWVGEATKEFWSVFRQSDIVRIMQSPGVFSNKEGPGPERMLQISADGMLLIADDPAHRRQRGIANKAFTPRMVQRLEPDLRTLAEELAERIRPLGRADLVADYAAPYTIRVVARMIGVGEERVEDFLRWGNDTINVFGADDEGVRRSFVSMMEFHEYMTSLITPRREALARGEGIPDDVLSAMIAAESEDGWRLDDQELLMGCQQFMTAGFETAMTTMASAVHLLCTHPEQRAKLEADPALMGLAVEEVLRFASPLEGICRTALEDTEVGGVPVPKGAKIRLMLASAGRDEQQFERAGEFDITRDPAELRRHISFGVGVHTCIGAALARAELRIGISTLLAALPNLRLDPDEEPTRNPAFLVSGFSHLPVVWDV